MKRMMESDDALNSRKLDGHIEVGTRMTRANRKKRLDSRYCLGPSNDKYYSLLLHSLQISRQKWLAEEYVSSRISEKQFLEALLIETLNHLASTEGVRETIRTNQP